MFSQRAILMELSILIASCFLAASSHAATLRLSTSEREFRVTTFQSPGSAPRAAVVVLSGAKGYGAGAYSRLTSSLNAAGIDVFLVHFISDADVVAMESAGSARARIAYYGRRMREWRETVRVTIDAIGRQPIYDRSKIGALGISLGAMPVMAETANSSTIHATAAVDGGFPANFQTRVHSMPPFWPYGEAMTRSFHSPRAPQSTTWPVRWAARPRSWCIEVKATRSFSKTTTSTREGLATASSNSFPSFSG